MPLEDMVRKDYTEFLKKHGGRPVPQEVMDNYRRAMNEAAERCMREKNIRDARTAQMLDRIFFD